MNKDISIEYAHIYANKHISDEQKLSLEILSSVKAEHPGKKISLVVMIDDYSFPDPTFDYNSFDNWLGQNGFPPDVVLRESQLIPLCDEVLMKINDNKIRNPIIDYIKSKKYPCSLFIASWYLLRLGVIESSIFNKKYAAKKLINILPLSFKPFEDKAIEIINSTPFSENIENIENKYFEGRLMA